jgi:hypothetical protein
MLKTGDLGSLVLYLVELVVFCHSLNCRLLLSPFRGQRLNQYTWQYFNNRASFFNI